MKRIHDIYFSDNAAGQARRLLKIVKHRKWEPGIFVIALSDHPDNLLDIYEAVQLLQPYYKEHGVLVLGIAFGKEDAFGLAADIIDELYQNTGGFDLKQYFFNKD